MIAACLSTLTAHNTYHVDGRGSCQAGLLRVDLARAAKISDKYCVIRTMTHPHNDHNACHYIQTGHKWTRTA